MGLNTTTYVVQYKELDVNYSMEINVTNGSTSITLLDLAPSTVYSWKVSSNCAFRSLASALGAAFLTLDDGDGDPPPPPGAFQVCNFSFFHAITSFVPY